MVCKLHNAPKENKITFQLHLVLIKATVFNLVYFALTTVHRSCMLQLRSWRLDSHILEGNVQMSINVIESEATISTNWN